MTVLTAGADIGAMLTGVSAVAAAGVWIRQHVEAWRVERERSKLRAWHGYIMAGSINTWYVRVTAAPADENWPDAVLRVEVVDRNGRPDLLGARSLQAIAERDGMLARAPTVEESEFLADLVRARRADGFPIPSVPPGAPAT